MYALSYNFSICLLDVTMEFTSTSWEIYILILVMAFINPWGRIKNIYLNFGDGFYKSLGVNKINL